MKKIAFIGATGMLGKPVAQELINAGFKLTILARNAKKAQALFPKATIIEGSLESKEDIKKVLVNQDAVYLSLSVEQDAKPDDWHTEKQGIDNLIEVAKLLNTKRIAFLSSLVMNYQGTNGFDWWVFKIKHEAVEKIKASGLVYTIFYPSTFMDTYQQQIAGPSLQMAGISKFPMWFVSAKDYGKQVAKSFKILNDSESKNYIIQGLEPFDYQQANQIFIQNYPKKLWLLTVPSFMLSLAAKFSQKMDYLGNIMESLNSYPETFQAESTWQELGKPEITLAQFAKNY